MCLFSTGSLETARHVLCCGKLTECKIYKQTCFHGAAECVQVLWFEATREKSIHIFSVGVAILHHSMPSGDQLHLVAMLGWAKADASAKFHAESYWHALAFRGAC